MREKILAVVDELKRRKAEGETRIFVSDETLDALDAAILRKRSKRTSAPAPQPAPAKAAQAARMPEPVLAPEREPVYAPAKPVEPKPMATASQSVKTLPPPPDFTLPEGDKRMRWEWLRNRVLACPVCNANLNPGKQVVFGNGNIDSPIFFCGEAPGADEEEQGIPFVGKAGQLLVKIIAAMGFPREQVYIGNIMNWRPQMGGSLVGNRPPSEEEMAFCLPYLRAQVAVVQPKVIVALGNTALKGLLGPKTPGITTVRGTWLDFNGTPLMPTFHPSYVLRYGNDTTKRQIWEDMLAVMEKVNLPISDKQRGYFMPKPTAPAES
jgi:uracil-DNA glycosylase